MVNPTPANDSAVNTPDTGETPPTPLRCFTGAVISGAIGSGLYFLTMSIYQTFAQRPLQSTNPITVNIGAAVRTLVLGMSCLGMVTFGIATVGLTALGLQLLFKGGQTVEPSKPESGQ